MINPPMESLILKSPEQSKSLKERPEIEVIKAKLETEAQLVISQLGDDLEIDSREFSTDEHTLTCYFQDSTRSIRVSYSGGYITALGVTSSWSPTN